LEAVSGCLLICIFHIAKSDFKYSDRFLTKQSVPYFSKHRKIKRLQIFCPDRELSHTLRYHQSAIKTGAAA
jgi:hypothetical protein